MFPVTITVHNKNQLDAILAAMATGAKLEAAEQPVPAAAKAKPAADKPKAQEQAESPKDEAAPSSAPTPTASDNSASSSTESEAASNTKAATYEDAKKAILTLSKEKGRQASVDALARFGAEKLPDLPKDRYADLVALVEEVMAGAEV